jgi:AAA15 family ATPase/GTPase
MIIELSVKNCFVFSLDPTNKTTAIYGPNNADKTCLIKCIQAMKEILLNQRIEIKSNLFSNDSVCELGFTFEYEKNILSFCLLFWTLGVIFFLRMH